MNKKLFLLVLVFVAAFLVRFYNFEERVVFGPEQAISLITSAKMIEEKLTLLGLENVQRVTSTGHRLFSGALFSYSLIPLLLVFDYHPLPITMVFAFLNLFTGLVLFLVARSIFNDKVAIFSTFLFLFSAKMIYHSGFIWILNYLPLVGVLTVYFLWRQKFNENFLNPFMAGILSGVGFSLEYVYLFTAFVVFVILIRFSTRKFVAAALFSLGCLIPNLPVVIFDLRHGFYHLWTLWQYFLDTLQTPGQAGFSYYHLLHMWPVFAMAAGYLLAKWSTRENRLLIVLAMIYYLIFNFNSISGNLNSPMGMPKDLMLSNVLDAAHTISSDNPEPPFNVAVIADFDTRGHILRYPLKYIYGKEPDGVENYPDAKSLYVLAQRSYELLNPKVWELRSFMPYNVELLSYTGDEHAVYKLTK